MRLKLIACKVLAREIGFLSAQSANSIDITFLRQGLHNDPGQLRRILQEEIDRVDSGRDMHSNNTGGCAFDAILLGYGLCSNGTAGVSSRKHSLVIPRAHDCISLFLGSKERYRRIFDAYSGKIYWYTPGWIESCPMPSREKEQDDFKKYTEQYGADNAAYLMETECGWRRDYKAAAYIAPPFGDFSGYRAFTEECARYFGWEFMPLVGDNSLLRDLLEGNWDSGRFLVLPPGSEAAPSFDEGVLKEKD